MGTSKTARPASRRTTLIAAAGTSAAVMADAAGTAAAEEMAAGTAGAKIAKDEKMGIEGRKIP